MTNHTTSTARETHTMKPTAVVVTVTATTASGATFSFSHPAESGELFLNSLLLAAIPAAHRIANITHSDADPYLMRGTYYRLNRMYEDERTARAAREFAAIRADELMQAWEASRWEGQP